MSDLAFLTDYLVASLRVAVPLGFAALGGLWSERSGVINIALEGMLLTGAFVSAAVAATTGQVGLAIAAASLAAGLVGLGHAALCVSLRVNQLVSGLAINLSVAGLTAFGARLVFREGTTQGLPALGPLPLPAFLQHLPLLGPLVFAQDWLTYGLWAGIGVSLYLLFYTHYGLALRAVGEAPQAAETAGVSVILIRYLSVGLSGLLCGLGGAYLTLVHVKFFAEGMVAGKGFIALAAVIFGRWHPIGVFLACVLFGATEALQLRIQALNLQIPYQFLVMLPYAIALLALLGLAGKSVPPAALGVPYVKED
ncbi:ABC transporter permease [Trichothermofontia sichuanensis B231]|uniref:ABC transporter permease n=1 Tax=Trichothermofontia sichuanensis TaxID=3045816 RepID=UPI0022460AEE|nr:ABC transporter permease [Trichothermofontia sichuanensis]UZQ53299.1 ABC transporter permease [Trichothermofontia sichuanensis B231]